MLRLAADADVHNGIIRGLRRQTPELDLLRAQDALPEGTPDPRILEWAAAESRVLITNDRETIIGFAYDRLAAAQPMPGIILTTSEQSVGAAIEGIMLIAECLSGDEMRDRIIEYLPL